MADKITTAEKAVEVFNERRYLDDADWLVNGERVMPGWNYHRAMGFMEAKAIANGLNGYTVAIETKNHLLEKENRRLSGIHREYQERCALQDKQIKVMGELDELRNAETRQLKAQIDAFWTALSSSWDIEPRKYFESEIAKGIGFDDSPMAMALHYVWKRQVKKGKAQSI